MLRHGMDINMAWRMQVIALQALLGDVFAVIEDVAANITNNTATWKYIAVTT